MVRRFGTLGVGALLTVSLGTGCLTTTGETAPSVRPQQTAVSDTPARSREPQTVILPRVTEDMPPHAVAIEPPQPPPEPQVRPVQLETPVVATPERIALAPVEAPEAPLLLAVRRLMDKQPSEAVEALQKYDKQTREMLAALLPLTVRVSEGGLEKATPQELATLLEELNQATAALRARAPLTIEKMRYCRRIGNYGTYDPLPDDHPFTLGERHHGELVQLYVEARHFINRQNGKFYETALGSKLEIRDGKGELAAPPMLFPAQADRSLSLRQDYFIHYQFYVPARVEPGDYTLTLWLRDDNAAGGEDKWTLGRTLPFHVR